MKCQCVIVSMSVMGQLKGGTLTHICKKPKNEYACKIVGKVVTGSDH